MSGKGIQNVQIAKNEHAQLNILYQSIQISIKKQERKKKKEKKTPSIYR